MYPVYKATLTVGISLFLKISIGIAKDHFILHYSESNPKGLIWDDVGKNCEVGPQIFVGFMNLRKVLAYLFAFYLH